MGKNQRFELKGQIFPQQLFCLTKRASIKHQVNTKTKKSCCENFDPRKEIMEPSFSSDHTLCECPQNGPVVIIMSKKSIPTI